MKALSPHKLAPGEILILNTTKRIPAWIQHYAFNSGKSKVFQRVELTPGRTLVLEEESDLWLINDQARQRIRLYDFPIGSPSSQQSFESKEIANSVAGAISAGGLVAKKMDASDWLMRHKTQRLHHLPNEVASRMLASCDLLPASTQVRAEYRALSPI
jgi:hypothetical protein